MIGGDRQRAMKRLRVPPLGEQQSPWTTFKVGLFSGSFIVLVITVILSGNHLIFITISLHNSITILYLQLYFVMPQQKVY